MRDIDNLRILNSNNKAVIQRESKSHCSNNQNLALPPEAKIEQKLMQSDTPEPKFKIKSKEESFAAYVAAYKRIEAASQIQKNHPQEFTASTFTTAPYSYFSSCSPMAYSSPIMCPNYGFVPFTEMLTGRIKFFDSTQGYGFFVVDSNGTDLFVHYDEFMKIGMTVESIQMAASLGLKFSFQKVMYYGRYNLSSKAINIQMINAD